MLEALDRTANFDGEVLIRSGEQLAAEVSQYLAESSIGLVFSAEVAHPMLYTKPEPIILPKEPIPIPQRPAPSPTPPANPKK